MFGLIFNTCVPISSFQLKHSFKIFLQYLIICKCLYGKKGREDRKCKYILDL